MTRDGLKVFLSDLRTAVVSREPKDLGAYFVWPVVIYTSSGVTVVHNEYELQKIIGHYLAALRAWSITSSSASIETREPQMNNRVKATVRMAEYDASGRQVTNQLVRFFLVEEAESYKIEMLEYIDAPLTVVDSAFIVR